MDYFLLLSSSGLAQGALYAMIAMGFALIFKATSVVNFAQGEVMMLVAYIAYSISGHFEMGFWPLLACTIVISAFCGLAIEYLFIRPMLGEPLFSTVMVTIGIAVMIRSLTVMIWGPDPIPFNSGLDDDLIQIGIVGLQLSQIYTFVLLGVVVLSLWLFFRFSRIGVAMRATANRETTALLMGINVKRIFALAWSLSAIIAGLSGVLLATTFELGPDMWAQGLHAFPAVILGGLDSVFGAALGGLIIGLVEHLSDGYFGHGLKEISGFIVILVVLMIRPYGLFGTPDIERV